MQGQGFVTALHREYPAYVEISDDNETFAHIPDEINAIIGPNIVFVRYVNFADRVNAVCLQFTRNNIFGCFNFFTNKT